MERLISLLIGYCFGMFQTGYLYGRVTRHSDIRDYGSHNAGSTNILRTWGVKAALIVFLGDAFKAIFAIALVRVIFQGSADTDLWAMYAALGAALGHDYPFYLKFRGGKGIAAMAGVMTAMDIRISLVCLVIFSGTVFFTRYVSLGSILISITFFLMNTAFCAAGYYQVTPKGKPEFIVVTFLVVALAIGRHHANIHRLITGTESRISIPKK
jgi:glycerol-3-phosphate acyltransferase PlsY